MNIKDNLKVVLADRGYLTALIFMAMATIGVILLGVFNIRPSELQIPVRYTSFGITNFYRERWYYLLALITFALIVAVTHLLVSMKLYQTKGRHLAIGFVWLTFIELIIASIFIFAIFRVVALSQ